VRRSALFALAAILAAAGTAYAVPSTGGASAKADQRDRVICRRFVRTGSLVDGYRTCKTRAEWDREHENVQHFSVSDGCRLRGEGGSGCAQ
jgi:hypothetical protein